MGINSSGTGANTSAFNTNATNPYFAYPFSVSKLAPVVRRGLLAPGILSLVSIVVTAGLLLYLGYRFINWREYSKRSLGHNQYLVLFVNLLLADLIQALSFVISLHWVAIDALLAPTPACTAQGWLLNMGDVASGFFVLLIAAFTFHSIIHGRRLDHKIFVGIIIFAWLFSFVLTFIGPAMYGRTYYVRAGAWCWASALYETERLALHYVWIFAVQALTLIIYISVFFHVRRTMNATTQLMSLNQPRSTAHRQIDRATRSMIAYPIAYICLTLPLSAGRMWSLAHNGAFLPDAYVLVAGSLMSSSGFVDALLYAFTRSQLMAGGSTNASTDPLSSSGLMSEKKQRPGMLRAISARFDSHAPTEPDFTNDLPTSPRPPPDPYCLEDFRSIRRRSSAPEGSGRRRSSAPGIMIARERAERSVPPADYGFGYAENEHFAARSQSGTGLGVSIEDLRKAAAVHSVAEVDEESPGTSPGAAEEKF